MSTPTDERRLQYKHALDLALQGDVSEIYLLLDAIRTTAWKAIDLYQVIDVVGSLRDERAVETLAAFLSAYWGHAHFNALRALLNIGSMHAISVLVEELRSPTLFGIAAAQNLASAGKLYLPQLLPAAIDQDPIMRKHAIYAIALIAEVDPNPTVMNALVHALKDEIGEVRSWAATGLFWSQRKETD